MMSSSGLNVIALVSGGKDSLFCALHCLANGHRLVALANLQPPTPSLLPHLASDSSASSKGAATAVERILSLTSRDPSSAPSGVRATTDEDADLNSFMYQTVGHQIIPLYAEATGLPLYRRPIIGGAVFAGRDYAAAAAAAGEEAGEDETESMVPLLRVVMAAHPEANALCAGAILSTYQRTRVESVAMRLGLVTLAYLWKYPVLPPPGNGAKDEAQLLLDMAAAGLDPRIIKVASGGLIESFLWENVASAKGVSRLKKAMGRFGSAGLDTGAVLGEGGEFETLVVDGPARLFKKRLVVEEEDRVVVREGGGQAWLKVTRARLEDKTPGEEAQELGIRRPGLYDERFAAVLNGLRSDVEDVDTSSAPPTGTLDRSLALESSTTKLQTWAFTTTTTPNTAGTTPLTIQEETTQLTNAIHARLAQHGLAPTSIISTAIILRSMAAFPAVNAIYGALFTTPNPPSRVTIACGDLFPPQSGNIAIYLTLHPSATDRQGLHVQSRSYWAPANIGPYSQAISVPISPRVGGARIVHIAGQIPLVPATMELPTDGVATQLALSLQHLWRVGAEVGVQWWTSAAVYFPRAAAGSPLSRREKARLAWKAWRDAHRWSTSSEEDEDESGPDLWDRKYNPLYMSYGDAAEEARLPDYALLRGDAEDSKPVPFFFAVEVDELPRSAEAEWHAHAGLSGLKSGSDLVSLCVEESEGATVEHCVLISKTGGYLHSVVALKSPDEEPAVAGGCALAARVQDANSLFGASLAELASEGDASSMSYLVYVNTAVFAPEEISQAMGGGLPIIPCASIYGGSRGAALELVALYRRGLASGEET